MKLLQSGQFPLLTISSLEHILQKVWPQGIEEAALCLTMQIQQVCSMEPPPSSPSSSASSSKSSSSLNIYLDPSSPISLSVSSNKSISDIITGACSSSSASCAAASDASCAATASLADSVLSPGFSPSSSPSSSSKLSRKVTTRPRRYGSAVGMLAELRNESCGRRVPAVLFSAASPVKRVEPRRLNEGRIAGAAVGGGPGSSVAGLRSSTW